MATSNSSKPSLVGTDGEGAHRLARGEPLQLRYLDLDHEAPAGTQVRGDVAEAGDLLVLRRQVLDGVVDEVRELERLVDAHRREVADGHADGFRAGLGAQLGDHRR